MYAFPQGPQQGMNPMSLMLLSQMALAPSQNPFAPATANQAQGNSQPGGNVGVDDTSGGYSRGSQFAPGAMSPTGGLPAWMTNPALPPGMDYGSMAGLTMAENAGHIGQGLGALLGIPGGRQIGNYFGNRYINNHVFQSPADTQGDFANALDEMLYGAVPQSSPADTTGAVRDNATRAGSQNMAYSGIWGPGTGSRMNANSSFIFGMPGFNNVAYEPQRVNLRVHRDKPGGN